MTQGNDGSLSTVHANSSMEVFNRIATYAIQSAERLPVEATHMLIAGAVDFVVFIEKRNDYSRGGRLRRFVSSIREVTGVDGRVQSSEVFSPGPDGRAVPHAPVACAAQLAEHGYDPARGSVASFVFSIAESEVADQRRRAGRHDALVARLSGHELLDADDIARAEAAIELVARLDIMAASSPASIRPNTPGPSNWRESWPHSRSGSASFFSPK